MDKPSLFVGSSKEGIDFARAVRDALANDAEVTVWDEGFFALSHTFIEGLITGVPRFDFAVLVLTPDDFVVSRAAESFGPRDNLLFELGLFMGSLGRGRTFVLRDASADLKMPSDLSGLVTASYDWPRKDVNHRAAVGAACDRMRKIVRDLGVIDRKAAKALNEIRTRQDEHSQELSRQQAQIRSLQVALQGIVTKYEFDKLNGLQHSEPFMCYYSDDLFEEMKHLRAMGLVHHQEGSGLAAMKRGYKDRNNKFDLRDFFYLTAQGREYLALRQQMMAEDAESP